MSYMSCLLTKHLSWWLFTPTIRIKRLKHSGTKFSISACRKVSCLSGSTNVFQKPDLVTWVRPVGINVHNWSNRSPRDPMVGILLDVKNHQVVPCVEEGGELGQTHVCTGQSGVVTYRLECTAQWGYRCVDDITHKPFSQCSPSFPSHRLCPCC